jgi:surfeit locus 1 family protein
VSDKSARLLLPSLLTTAAFAVLIALGVWQLERKTWKEDLIAAMTARLAAAPQALPAPETWPQLAPGTSEFMRVRLRADFLPVPDTYAYVAGSALRDDIKAPGYFVFRPARLPDGRIVAINRGYVPLDYATQSPAGTVELTGYLRWPEPPSWFVSTSDAAGRSISIRRRQFRPAGCRGRRRSRSCSATTT